MRRSVYLLIGASLCIGCSNRPEQEGMLTSPDFVSHPFDTLYIFARNSPDQDAELAVIRDAGLSTVTLIRQARDGRPRLVLDSVGPVQTEPNEVTAMLDSFDVWALNAPNAPGAACRTTSGQRVCNITFNDYSLVMKVVSGREVRVQRYTHLEESSANRSARGLADRVLAWARKLEAQR